MDILITKREWPVHERKTCRYCWILKDMPAATARKWKERSGLIRRCLSGCKNDYIIIALYTDDRTKLPESEWITSSFDGKVKKTLGKKNLDLQISRYSTNTQPFYVLIDTDGNPLAEPRGHNLDIQAFRDWLDAGERNFNMK